MDGKKVKRPCSTLVLGRAWLPLQHEFEHHLLVAFAQFSQVQQPVLNGLFTSPSWALRGTGITALPPQGMVNSHLLPATRSSGAHLGSVTNTPACLLFSTGFVFLQQVELHQLMKGEKKPQQKQRQQLTGGACCWTGPAHLVSPHCRGSFTPSELM